MAFEIPETAEQARIPNRIGLIDADCVAYWGASGCDEMTKLSAFKRVDDRMSMIRDQIQTDELRLYLTGKDNFRNGIATYQQYKGNRYDKNGNRIKPQPLWLPECRQYLIDQHAAVLCNGQEADDSLAIAQTKCNASKTWHSIISSIDKDLLIIPGNHHDMNSGYIQIVDELGKLFVDAKGKVRGTGLKFFYAQLLMGDSADWIPGLPKVTPEMKEQFGIKRLGGCGPKAALSVLEDAETEREMLRRVLDCYAAYWNGDRFYVNWRTDEEVYPQVWDILTEQGQLLWMRRSEGDMWEPNHEWFEEWRADRDCKA